MTSEYLIDSSMLKDRFINLMSAGPALKCHNKEAEKGKGKQKPAQWVNRTLIRSSLQLLVKLRGVVRKGRELSIGIR